MELGSRNRSILEARAGGIRPLGVVVQSVEQPQRFGGITYSGIGIGEPWPLAFLAKENLNNEEIDLIRRVDSWQSDLVDRVNVIPDLYLVRRFLDRCNVHGIVTRSLLCSGDSWQPGMDHRDVLRLQGCVRFLGFDHSSYQCDDSSILTELYRTQEADPVSKLITDSLRPYLDGLNEYGLFPTENDIRGYVQARSELTVRYPEAFPCELPDGASTDATEDDAYLILKLEEIDPQFFAM